MKRIGTGTAHREHKMRRTLRGRIEADCCLLIEKAIQFSKSYDGSEPEHIPNQVREWHEGPYFDSSLAGVF